MSAAEQSVIGAALIDARALAAAAELLPDPGVFNRDDHRTTWATMLAMHANGEPVDVITLAERLGDKLKTVGGLNYLCNLASEVATPAHASVYAATVAEAAAVRRLREAALTAAEDAGRRPLVDIADELREALGNLASPRWPAPVNLGALARTEPRPPQWIVPDWLPAGYAALHSGHGGTGKSAITLHLAACIASGRPWFGIPTERRPVLFVSCEDRVDVLHWRLARICNHLDIDLADLCSHLDVLDLVGHDAILWSPQVIKTGQPSPAFRELRRTVEKTGAEVLIIDGISDTFGGAENARAEVRAYIAALLSLIDPERGAVILIGHVDKATANNGATGNGYSGSTAWHNSVRARWYLRPESGGEGELTGDLLLEQQKSNHGTSGRSIRFTWDRDAHLFTGRPVTPATALDHAAHDRRERAGILAAMRAVIAAGDYIPAATTGQRTAFHVLSARPEFPDSIPRNSAGRRHFWRQIEALRQMGEVTEDAIRRTNRHSTAVLVLATNSPVEKCADAPNG